MRTIWTLNRLVNATARGRSQLPARLSMLAFAISTGALLVTGSGLMAFLRRTHRTSATLDDPSSLYLMLALVGSATMIVPIVTLGGVAARLALARRDARLAALRLAGATTSQVSLLTLLEAVTQAAIGALGGVGLYLATWPLLATLRFNGAPLGLRDLWLGAFWIAAAVAGIVLLALVSAATTLAQVRISPLGVAQRITPRALSVLRLALGAIMLVGWLVATKVGGQLGVGVIIAILVAVIATVNVVGPFAVMLTGRVLAATARTAPQLLAARRIVDDPRTTWRAVGSLGLGVLVAAAAGGWASLMRQHPEPGTPWLAGDLITGATIALIIIALVSATSSGVVMAGRVFDQAATLRSLVMAGVLPSELEAARRREVTAPLVIALTTSALFCLLLMAPAAASLNLGALALFASAVAGSFLVLRLAVAASRPLVGEVTSLST